MLGGQFGLGEVISRQHADGGAARRGDCPAIDPAPTLEASNMRAVIVCRLDGSGRRTRFGTGRQVGCRSGKCEAVAAGAGRNRVLVAGHHVGASALEFGTGNP